METYTNHGFTMSLPNWVVDIRFHLGSRNLAGIWVGNTAMVFVREEYKPQLRQYLREYSAKCGIPFVEEQTEYQISGLPYIGYIAIGDPEAWVKRFQAANSNHRVLITKEDEV